MDMDAKQAANEDYNSVLLSYHQSLKQANLQLRRMNSLMLAVQDNMTGRMAPELRRLTDETCEIGSLGALSALTCRMHSLWHLQRLDSSETAKLRTGDDDDCKPADPAVSAAWFQEYCRAEQEWRWHGSGSIGRRQAQTRLNEIFSRRPQGFDLVDAVMYESKAAEDKAVQDFLEDV